MSREHIVDTQTLNRAKNNNTLCSCFYTRKNKVCWSATGVFDL